jgi:chemotaxis protein methyltransferase CheR
MMGSLPEQTMQRASEYIEDRLALHYPSNRWNDLEHKITRAAEELGYTDGELFVRHMTSSVFTREQDEILISHLTVNETYFWREPGSFDALVNSVLPGLIRSRHEEKRIRIWSAGCSTGEEPYSIAMALQTVVPQPTEWNISILATDMNPQSLQTAAAGVYGERSFRRSPPWVKQRFFSNNGNGMFTILPAIQRMVHFTYLNLAEAGYPSLLTGTNAMDIIFCRNVLIYFTERRCSQVVRGLFNTLVPGGHLIVSASELSLRSLSQFTPVNYPESVLYRKDTPNETLQQTVLVVEPLAAPQEISSPVDPVTHHPVEKVPAASRTVNKDIPRPENDAALHSVYDTAKELYRQGKYSHVVEVLHEKQLTSDERILLIRTYANQGKLDDAAQLCTKAVAADKLNPGLHYLYATILQEYHRLHEAVTSLQRALYLDPNFVLAQYSLGKIYLMLGNNKSADKCAENVLAILKTCGKDDILFESEGLSAGRFKEMIDASKKRDAL